MHQQRYEDDRPDQPEDDEQHQRFERMECLTEYVHAMRTRGLSRRAFLKYGLSLGLSLPAISAILTGCGMASESSVAVVPPTSTPTPPPTPTPTSTPAPSATPTPDPTPTSTPDPTPTPEPVARFAVIGDFGLDGEPEAAVAAMVKSWNPDFIVTTGDNNYPNGAADTIDANIGQYYQEYIGNYQGNYGPGASENRFFPVIGNHDTDADEAQSYFAYFTLPGNERYYTVDRYPVRIFALNSVPWVEPDGVYADSVQALWLKAELAKTPDYWNLVFFHHPPYSSGYRGGSTWMRWPFKAWGADAVFAGHNHTYERILLDGQVYFVNGLGGGARYAFANTIMPEAQVIFNRDHGAMRIEATRQQITYQFLARSGEVIDTATMEKSA